MPIIITAATDPQTIDEVFKIRHKVFVQEEGKFSESPDTRMMDRFDVYPTTTNLVVKSGETVVGSFRLTLDSDMGVPADEYYDFRRHLPESAKVMGAGMLCVSDEYRDPKFSTGLIQMASYFAFSHGVTHTIAPINPDIARMLVRRVGCKVVGQEFEDTQTGIKMLPLVFDFTLLKDYFLSFVKQNQLIELLGDFERWFYREGEHLIKAGEQGNEAFIMIEGHAQIRLPESKQAFSEIHRGEIFGELALLTDEKRSADVVATSDVQVMRLSKENFMQRFTTSPSQALNLLKLLGERNLQLIHKLDRQVKN